MIEIDFALSTDKRVLSVALPLGHNCMVLEAGELDAVIAKLGELRQKMAPQVPESPTQGKPIAAMIAPVCGIALETLTQQPLLQVRDLRFGWLHYVMPPKLLLILIPMMQKAAADAAAEELLPKRQAH